MKIHESLTREFINEEFEEERDCGVGVEMMNYGYCIRCGNPEGADFDEDPSHCHSCESSSVYHIAYLYAALNR